ncbi:hypothetical protein Tco_0548172 [Tanacetum coccineum]
MVAASKVPMLKPGEFEIWRMRIEQYTQMIDYALWEVIENGATLPKTTTVEGVVTVMPITTAEETAQRRLELKAMKYYNDKGHSHAHQLKFNSIKDAKKLLEAVKKRFGSLLLMEMRLLVLINPKWSATTAIRGDILLRSTELQEIKTTRSRKAQEGVCLWKTTTPPTTFGGHVMVLVDMTRVIRQRKGLIMHSWLSHLQILTQRYSMILFVQNLA